MEKPDYRTLAKQCLERAKGALLDPDPERLRFAALQLRMTIEALAYERMYSYRRDVPPEEYSKWQPRRVLELLLEIDSTADQSCELHIGDEPDGPMQNLGTESVFSLSATKKHYDALGSFLHLPTLAQMQSSKSIDLAGDIQARSCGLVPELQKVLSSPIYNVNFGNFANTDCFRCGKPVRRRLPKTPPPNSADARCFSCDATYRVDAAADGKIQWVAHQETVPCQRKECGAPNVLWSGDIQPGRRFSCNKCGVPHRLIIAVQLEGEVS